jgi:hypothetical protein
VTPINDAPHGAAVGTTHRVFMPLPGGRRWPRRTRLESFEVPINPFHEGHEPPPVGSLFFGAGRFVLEAFKLETERGELL